MKLTNLLFIIVSAWLSYSCSSSSSNTSNEEQPVVEAVATTEEFSYKGENEIKLKEQLFFHLREKVVAINKYTFVKYEELVLNNLLFEYKAVIMDSDMLTPLAEYNPRKANIILASYQIGIPNQELGDTINIKGKIEISELPPVGEAPLTEVMVSLSADFSNSYLYSDVYEGPTRILETSTVQQTLMVKLNEPRIYPKSGLYIKARIAELTENDLSGMSKDEMAYLRNEIFARHGHRFKTDKMKSYFSDQDWYQPFFEDATDFLNDIEKKNAKFIKSMES